MQVCTDLVHVLAFGEQPQQTPATRLAATSRADDFCVLGDSSQANLQTFKGKRTIKSGWLDRSASQPYQKRSVYMNTLMNPDEVKQAIAYHQQALQRILKHADTPERWEHLGAIDALATQLDEYLVAQAEQSLHCRVIPASDTPNCNPPRETT
jgi:hypothetical protein